MKVYESAENYLETILVLTQRNGSVRSVDIAAELGFSKPSVSVAMKTLGERGYVIKDKQGQIKLTEKGAAVAARVYERHTVLRDGLIQLGVDPDVAEEDACRMEHILSQQSFEAIKKVIEKGR